MDMCHFILSLVTLFSGALNAKSAFPITSHANTSGGVGNIDRGSHPVKNTR